MIGIKASIRGLALAAFALLCSCDGAFVRVSHFQGAHGQEMNAVELTKIEELVAEAGFFRTNASQRDLGIAQEFHRTVIAWFDTDREPSSERGSFCYVSISRLWGSQVLEIEIRAFPASRSNPHLDQLHNEIAETMEDSGWYVLSNPPLQRTSR